MSTPAPAGGFSHLHVHTEFSALDGLIRLDDAFELAATRGEPALAVTDHGTLGGLWKAQSSADKHGVKLIPGCEVYLAFGSRFNPGTEEIIEGDVTDDSDAVDGEATATKTKKYMHLTLLATNAAGWRNLVLITNKSAETPRGKYPLTDMELIKEHSEGITILTGCLGGPILGRLAQGQPEKAEAHLLEMIDAVGADRVFVEVMEHGIEQESAILPAAHEMAVKHGVKLVATNDAHHTHAEDRVAHEAWLALRSGTVLSDPKRYHFHGDGFHLRSEVEMLALRPESWWAEAVANTALVAAMVEQRVLPRSSPKLPKFPTPDGFEDNVAYYMHLVRAGLDRIYGPEWPQQVRDRINEELNVIRPMGFIDYFLIVEELTSWARSQNILVGPGRGSGAGSLTAYALGITGIDPLENNLLFERFLEPGRSDFPDFDIDFESLRREEILDHLEDKWGKGNVALIGSFGSAKSKRAIKDAARVLELPAIGNKLAKLIPVEGGSPLRFDALLDEAVASTAEFRKELEKAGDDGQRVLNLARGFDEAVNGVTIHACGVLISDTPLFDLIPLRIHKDTGRSITAWDSKDVEKAGFLKMDVLALRNLDIAAQAVKYIADTTGEVIDVDNLPHPNSKGNPRVDAAWRLLQDGRTAGIFQMESPAMANLSRQVQPESLADLSAVVALFRPGPLSAGMDQHFALRKQGKEAIDYSIWSMYPDEQDLVATRLGETYGSLVFQEQMMLLGATVAGFDAAGRSQLRRAVGKKDAALMEVVHQEFLAGAVVDVYDETTGELVSPAFRQETAERMWENFKGSASYLFNASHSAAYAQLAYVTAYLKANWPGAYGAAILSVTTSGDKRIEALHALPQEGIEILPPDVNLSAAHTAPEGTDKVRLGLSEIKGVGQAGERVVEARNTHNRPFKSLHDVVHRVRQGSMGKDDTPNTSYLPSNQIGALIESGAMDAFGPRMGMFTVSRVAKHGDHIRVPDMEWGVVERSARQRGALLVSIGEHPLSYFQDAVRQWNKPGPLDPNGNPFYSPAIPIGLLPEEDGANVTTIGLLAKFSEGSYRGGRKASISLEGSTESIDGIMWDRALTNAKLSNTVPPLGWPVAISGRITLREFEQEDEEGAVTVTKTRELTASNFYPVHIDDPVVGTVGEPAVVPVFTYAVDPENVTADPAPVPEEAAPPAVAVPAGEELFPEIDVIPEPEPEPEAPTEVYEWTEPVGSSIGSMAGRLRKRGTHPEIIRALRNIDKYSHSRPGTYELTNHAGQHVATLRTIER